MENLHEGSDEVVVKIQKHLKSGDLMGARREFRLALASVAESEKTSSNELQSLRNQVNKLLDSLGTDLTIINLVTSFD